MRKILPPLLVGLGAFLIVAALLATFWAPDRVERTPLDTNNTTYLSGTAQIASGPELELQETPVLAWSINRTDGNASDDDVAVWQSSLCVVRDEGGIDGCVDDTDERLISAEEEMFATDRRTALTVENGDYLPAGTPQQEGLQNKWPFGAEKKTYPVWDGMVGDAVDATYEGTEEIEGIETYHYVAEASAENVDVTAVAKGNYQATTDYFIEPRTGAIMKQVVHQVREVEGVGTVLDMNLSFTDEQVKQNVADAEDNISRLRLFETIVPIVGYAVGIPVLLIGVLLALRPRRRDS